MDGTTGLRSDHCNVMAVHVILLQTPTYLESLHWKVGDVVAVKIEEHQLLCTREGLGVDGLDGISFQVDTLNIWDQS